MLAMNAHLDKQTREFEGREELKHAFSRTLCSLVEALLFTRASATLRCNVQTFSARQHNKRLQTNSGQRFYWQTLFKASDLNNKSGDEPKPKSRNIANPKDRNNQIHKIIKQIWMCELETGRGKRKTQLLSIIVVTKIMKFCCRIETQNLSYVLLQDRKPSRLRRN